ncbi:hypothetical protein BURMUCGD2M_0905 [Burkholderia multivorans CGD2M]|uniref:Uncharacterized protein n=1 Tax=Burkholderia multivorans CGD2 TaxID=513052 RepID=B9BTK4_9BURK|nr:hypothetical protein BURMUCGD2_0814 [Burkholderia multivorans CGD2]EEE12808.1 hypothetical protein BURMUCGD2M_0905 [Burkholderia multivorans CGD2M]
MERRRPRAGRASRRLVWSEYRGHCTGATATVLRRARAICTRAGANAAAMIGAR